MKTTGVLLLLSVAAFACAAEPVETLRVHEYVSPVYNAPSSTDAGAAFAPTPAMRRWYEVSYAHRGTIHREVIGYDPGRQIELTSNGKPMRVPYDNPPDLPSAQ